MKIIVFVHNVKCFSFAKGLPFEYIQINLEDVFGMNKSSTQLSWVVFIGFFVEFKVFSLDCCACASNLAFCWYKTPRSVKKRCTCLERDIKTNTQFLLTSKSKTKGQKKILNIQKHRKKPFKKAYSPWTC